DAVAGRQHLLRNYRRREAGDHGVAALGDGFGRVGPVRALRKQGLGGLRIAVVDGEREAFAQQAARELGAEMAEADVAVAHGFAASGSRIFSGEEDDLAGEGLAEELPLGLHDLPQREGLPHYRLDVAALDVAHEVAEDLGLEHGAAEQAQILQVERAEVERHDRPGDRAGHRIAAAAFENLQQLRPLRPADDIDDDIHVLPADDGDKVALAPDDAIRAEGFDVRHLGGAGDSDDLRAAAAGQLHSRRADAAGCAGDQRRLALGETGPGEHVL